MGDLADPTELDEDSLDDLTEDDEEDEDAIDEEEDPKKKGKKKRRSCPAVLKGKKGFRPLIGYGQYCVCKAPPRAKKGDEAEISEDDVADHVENLAEDPKRRKKLSKKQKAKLFHKLIKGSFRRSDKCCYCTYNKKMVRLLAFLHKAHMLAIKGKMVFYFHFRKLVYAAVGRKKAAAYFKAL